MASAPLLDFAALLAPVPGDDPAGSGVPFDIRQKMEEGRKEEDPNDFAPDDPMRPESFKKADWAGVAALARKVLAGTSKDLLIAARLTEALVKEHGFPGLRDGLRLLRELVEQCWDRLFPPLEDEDLEVRAGPFHWLDDPDRGARFPGTLRMVPLVIGETGSYSWLDWRQSQDGRGSVTREDFDKASHAMALDKMETVAEDLSQSLEEMSKLAGCLSAKMGPTAPGLTSMRGAAEDCHRLLEQLLQRKRPAGAAAAAADGQSPASDGSAPRAVASTRAEAYRQLSAAAAVLQQLEPHSPIPYLVQRAVELGSLPFPELIKALIRDTNVLGELNRELGIKGEKAGEE